MSYALETKKRKFHRVLDSLTKSPAPESPSPSSSKPTTPTTPQPTTSADSSIKKVRLGDRSNDPELASVRKSVLKVARSASNDSLAPRPNFVPWDRERFLERLETFRRVDRWSPKPSAISEAEWAKRGWVCADVSRVSCIGGCGGSVVVKLPDELDELDGYDREKVQERREVRTKLVEEYVNLLAQGHGENCPWRNKGCDATIHRLPLSNPDTAILGLRTRYVNIAKMADQLPAQDIIQVPESFDVEEVIRQFPTKSLEAPQPSTEVTEPQTPQTPRPTDENETTAQSPQKALTINRTAFLLAFFGWDTVSDGAAGLAGCSACFRRLGLWMYKPKANGSMAVYDSLDVANEHMEYCPWISGKAQSGTDKPSQKKEDLRSGWELLAQALKVKHRRHIRSIVSVGSRATSETSFADEPVIDEGNDETKKASDREWWAKIRRMKQVLNVKSPKRKSAQ